MTPNQQKARDLNAAAGKNIRDARAHAGLTQEGLASAFGLSYQQVQKYETGANRMSVGTFILLANELGVPPIELLPELNGPLERVDSHGGTNRTIIEAVNNLKALKPDTRSAVCALLRAAVNAEA